MKHKLLTAALLMGSSVAMAQTPYIGVNYSVIDFPLATLGALMVKAGYSFNDYLSLEARFSVGVKDESLSIDGEYSAVDIEHSYGGFVKAGLPIDNLYPYFIVGYSNNKFESKIIDQLGADSYSDDISDLSYGIGIDIEASEQFSVNIEYMQYVDKHVDFFDYQLDVEVSGFNFGATYHF